MKALHIILIGLLTIQICNSIAAEAFVAEATEIIGVVRIGVSLVEYIYKVFSNILRDSGAADKVININKDQKAEKRLLAEYRVITNALNRLGHGYEAVEYSIRRMNEEFPLMIRRELKLNEVDQEIRSVWNAYQIFQTYQENKDDLEERTLIDFADAIISHQGDSIRSKLDNLHALVVPENGGGILGNRGVINLFADGIKDGKHLCSLGQSPHQVIYNLYNVIALTEIKGYAMIQFSYMIMRLSGQGNFTTESELAKTRFESQAVEKLIAVKAILPHMSRMFWRCDPDQPIEGETYVKITNLLQGHIENEIDLNGQASCRKSCEPYNFAKPKSCYKDLFCAKQPGCNGRLFDCGFYDADAWVCLSQNPERKYDWIEYEDGTRLGRKGQCANKIKVDSWWRWLFWHCSYCFCKCDAPGPNSDRYWSLKPALVDVSANKILTGLRFVKKNRIIQVEVQQSSPLPEGVINETDRSWIQNSSEITLDDKDDIFEMSYEERSLDLDVLEAPKGHVVTGLRFRKLGSHINLEARVTPIDFKTGILNASLSIWIGNDKTQLSEENRRTRVSLISPDIPTRYLGKNSLDSTDNQFVMFDSSSIAKDAAQTTVPYIDAQNVSPVSGVWITGIGLYHKGYVGYGGYVGFMTKTLDFSPHLLPEIEGGSGTSSRLMSDRLVLQEELKYDFSKEIK